MDRAEFEMLLQKIDGAIEHAKSVGDKDEERALTDLRDLWIEEMNNC